MDRRILLAAALAAVLTVVGCQSVPSGERFDIVIRGGTVYDGTGAPGRLADVGIAGGDGQALLIKKGKIVKRFDESMLETALLDEIEAMTGEKVER